MPGALGRSNTNGPNLPACKKNPRLKESAALLSRQSLAYRRLYLQRRTPARETWRESAEISRAFQLRHGICGTYGPFAGDVSSRPMKSSWLNRFSVQVAALAIACVALPTQAKMADPSSVAQPNPLDALANDPLLNRDHRGGETRHHGGGNVQGLHQGNTGGSAGGQVNCVTATPPITPPISHDGGRHHRRLPPTTTPTTAPCPPSDPGVNCVTDTPPISIDPPITPPITPPISHAGGRSHDGGRHHRSLPPTVSSTAPEVAPTTTAAAACPDPTGSNASGNGGASDNSGGSTDVIGSNDPHPHRHPPHDAPEPGTLVLLALGLGSLWLGRRLGKRR